MPQERPGSVPATASFDGSQWRDTVTVGDRTTHRSWWRDGALYRIQTLERGQKISIHDHHANGTLSHEWLYRDGRIVSERGWYEDGSFYFERVAEPGQPERSTRRYPSGALQAEENGSHRRTFYESGALAAERRDDKTTFHAEDGRVTATEEPREKPRTYWRREIGAGGHVEAEGPLDLRDWGPEGAAGVWRVYANDGSLLGEVDFARLEHPPKEGIAPIARVLLEQQSLPRAPWLRGIDAVAWKRQQVYFGKPQHLPFHLNGLSATSEAVFDQALHDLHNAVFHQGTVANAARPVAPYLVRAAASVEGQHRSRILELIAGMLSGGGFLGVALVNRRARKSSGIGTLRAELARRFDRWRHLALDGDAWAARILPLAANPATAGRVLGVARGASDATIRAELTLGLALCARERDKPWLETELHADDPRQRLCAALTLGRLDDPSPGVVTTLVASLATPPPGYDDLFWSSTTSDDVCAVLGQLGVELPVLLATFTSARAISAIGIAAALLDLTFRDHEGPPTRDQQTVLRAIADRDDLWPYVNLHELLRAWHLPTDRAKLLEPYRPGGSQEHDGVGRR